MKPEKEATERATERPSERPTSARAACGPKSAPKVGHFHWAGAIELGRPFVGRQGPPFLHSRDFRLASFECPILATQSIDRSLGGVAPPHPKVTAPSPRWRWPGSMAALPSGSSAGKWVTAKRPVHPLPVPAPCRLGARNKSPDVALPLCCVALDSFPPSFVLFCFHFGLFFFLLFLFLLLSGSFWPMPVRARSCCFSFRVSFSSSRRVGFPPRL